MTTNKKLKMALIAGASAALKQKEKQPHATENEIMQQVTTEADKLISKIDEIDEEF
jgi:hypothetical protein